MTKQNASILPLGNPGPSDWLTGEVPVQSHVAPEQLEGLYNVGQVTFRPGGRTQFE